MEELRRNSVPLLALQPSATPLAAESALLSSAAWPQALEEERARHEIRRREYGRVIGAWQALDLFCICLQSSGIAPSFPYRQERLDLLVPHRRVEEAYRAVRALGYSELRNAEQPDSWCLHLFVAGVTVSAIRLRARVSWQEEFVVDDELWRRAQAAGDDAAVCLPGREDRLLIRLARLLMEQRSITLDDVLAFDCLTTKGELDREYLDWVPRRRGWLPEFRRTVDMMEQLQVSLLGDSSSDRLAPRLPIQLASPDGTRLLAGKIARDRTLSASQKAAHLLMIGMRGTRDALDLHPQKSMLVTMSGIDGSGKSSHGSALIAAFTTCGIRIEGITARIGRLTPLRLLLVWVQRKRRKSAPANRPSSSRHPSRQTAAEHWTGWRLTLWAIATVFDYALWLQYVRWKLFRGNVVVADRYLADFAVEFTILVKSQARLADALLRPLPWLAPRPRRSYFLRIPAEVALNRKPEDKHGYEHYEVTATYDRLAGRYGLRVLDNTAPFEEVSTTIVRDAVDAYMERFAPVLNDLFLTNSRELNPHFGRDAE